MPRQKSTHVDDPLLVGERLRSARLRAGLSQRRLSFPGCSPAYISRVESGQRIPSLQLLRVLGRRLGVSEDWLATGSEDQGAPGGTLLEADVALRLGRLELAEALYSTLLERATSRAQAHEGLGRVALAGGNPRRAIEHLEAALALFGDADSAHPELAESLGRALGQAGDPEAAAALFERSIEEAERNGDVLEQARFRVLLGEWLVRAGDPDRAARALGRALEDGAAPVGLDARADLYWRHSRVLAGRGEDQAAARYARRALELLRAADDGLRAERARKLLGSIENARAAPASTAEL